MLQGSRARVKGGDPDRQVSRGPKSRRHVKVTQGQGVGVAQGLRDRTVVPSQGEL